MTESFSNSVKLILYEHPMEQNKQSTKCSPISRHLNPMTEYDLLNRKVK
jgi:hypothetical protein